MSEARSRPGSASADPNAKFVMQMRRPMSGRQRQLAAAMPFEFHGDKRGQDVAMADIEEKSVEFSLFEGDLEDLALGLSDGHDVAAGTHHAD